ncbi:MAG: caspase family protein [Bacteroidota bacterium]
MLISKRFTSIPTQSCRTRLAKALSNDCPVGRRERHRAAVIAIQSALADLNQDYLMVAEIDGYFGSRTYRAVEAFQRDYGLVADGFVGRQTLSQLDSLYSGDVIRQPRGMSIHIGVDRLDPNHYGNTFDLSSCVNDARKMNEIANSLGYDAVLLENEEATVRNFTSFMRSAIHELYSGDSLLLTFSGHGSQIPNTSLDEEADNKDETLCFYDRMLIDDELYALLGQFKEGVRVHLVFDSCHSGTVAKAKSTDELYAERAEYEKGLIAKLETKALAIEDTFDDFKPISYKNIEKALAGDQPEWAEEPKIKKENNQEIAVFFTELFNDENGGKAKSIEFFSPIYHNNQHIYDTIKNIVGPREHQQLSCSVISLSACQDSQTTPAGQVYSFFTNNIINLWQRGGFQGSAKQFHRNLKAIGLPNVTPALNTYGSNRAFSRLYDRPFVI